MNKLKAIITSTFILSLSSCALIIEDRKPDRVDNACYILKENKSWNRSLYYAEKNWNVPKHVILSIMHQESSFNHDARPVEGTFLWFFTTYKSTARGYAQALDLTWEEYKKLNDKGFFSSRESFNDSSDFMGWYIHRTHMQTGIPKWDAGELYFAYHEGNGGYLKKTYLKKPFLIKAADAVKRRSWKYERQLKDCDWDVGFIDKIIYKY